MGTDLLQDREHAGRLLAERLAGLDLERPVVLGLARGGVEVAAPVAAALDGELDVLVVRKVAQPTHPELGLGALSETGPVVWDDEGLARLGLWPDDLGAEVAAERTECRRRVDAYRGERSRVALATGVTALAALHTLRSEQPARLVLAAPVAAAPTVPLLAATADDVVVLRAPERFGAVSRYYVEFGQTSDETVVRLLADR